MVMLEILISTANQTAIVEHEISISSEGIIGNAKGH